ncbi:MAG: DUF3187 family protein [Gemmatimonadales bacterium]
MQPSYGPARRFVKRSYLPPVRRLWSLAALLVIALSSPSVGVAQGLPAFSPINPVAASRSGLSFLPYQEPRPGRWMTTFEVDYASTIEDNYSPPADYLLDSELLRLRLGLRRDLHPNAFVLLESELGGAYSGFLDGFLSWYHGVLGVDIPERDRRPTDEFLYNVELPDGPNIRGRPSDLFLGDLRVGLGVRVRPGWQSVLAFTLPTASGPAGYGRGVVSFNLLNTLRAPLNPRLIYEGSLGVGATPAQGGLAPVQRKLMVAASSGLRFRFWGRQSVYGNLFYHSPYYRGTSLPALDRRDLSLDFGWILATRLGYEWRVGLAEDLEPGGPAVDLIFRLGGGF